MAKKINIKGVIIPNDYKWIYDWFEIESTCPNDVNSQLEGLTSEELDVIINSGGGDVYSGSEIYTTIKDYKGNVTSKIVGIAASAASVIAMAGDKVMISPTAQIMIHNVSSAARGDYRVFEHESEVLKNYNKSIANAYILKSGMSQDELLDLMDKETWLNAQQAKEKKLVDEIMFDNDNKLVASTSNSMIIPIEVINKLRNEFLVNGIIRPSGLTNEGNSNKEEEQNMTLEELKNKYPDLFNQAKQEGYDEGVKAENERIKSIEDLGIPGFEDLVNKAKFENNDTAEKLAMNIIKAQKNIGKDYLDNLEKDANELKDVKGSEAPEGKTDEVKVKEGASLIAKYANKKRGGTK
mgnify:CR=1 FL=1